MGALHGGHISLILKSIQVCDNTIVSIYINPTQFAPDEDFNSYPKLIKEDIALLSNYKVNGLFIPTSEELYPNGLKTLNYQNNYFPILEGKSRPNFFYGVTTIVAKLFDIIQPGYAFFGEKDFQQFCVIKQMVKDLNYPINIFSCPTVREKSGLAMSSRNKYFNESELFLASILYKSLISAKKLIDDGERNSKKLKETISIFFSYNSLFNIDYISIANKYTLVEINEIIADDILISLAIYLGKTRLIDNISVDL
jgi:pantoate--beta-alanine ligase